MASPAQGFPQISAPFVTITDGIIEKSWLRFLVTLWLRSGSKQGGTSFSSGDIKFSASVDFQDGWLICDGAPVNRTDFPSLFAAIGVTWGTGDGTTTFNLPDFRDRVLVGSDYAHFTGTYEVGTAAAGSASVARYAVVTALIKT